MKLFLSALVSFLLMGFSAFGVEGDLGSNYTHIVCKTTMESTEKLEVELKYAPGSESARGQAIFTINDGEFNGSYQGYVSANLEMEVNESNSLESETSIISYSAETNRLLFFNIQVVDGLPMYFFEIMNGQGTEAFVMEDNSTMTCTLMI